MIIDASITNNISISRFETLEEDFKKIHGNKYDYSESVYKGVNTLMTICCSKHNYFKLTPADHLYRSKGCPKCYNDHNNEYQKIKIKNKLSALYSDKYQYPYFDSEWNTNKITLVCKHHGQVVQTLQFHLNGDGCKECKKILNSKNTDKAYARYKIEKAQTQEIDSITSKDELNIQMNALLNRLKDQEKKWIKINPFHRDFMNEARSKWGDLYDLSNTVYADKISVVCSIHGEFISTPKSFLSSGCPHCCGFHPRHTINTYKNRDTTLYLVKFYNSVKCPIPIKGPEIWKVGLTLKTPEIRFKYDIAKGIPMDVVQTWDFPKTGQIAFEAEDKILKMTRQFGIESERYFLEGGNSELRTRNPIKIIEGVVKELKESYDYSDVVF